MQPGSNVGERISAGLPNIIGTVYNVDGGGQSTAADGAFQVVSQYAAHGRGTNNSTHSSFNFLPHAVVKFMVVLQQSNPLLRLFISASNINNYGNLKIKNQ